MTTETIPAPEALNVPVASDSTPEVTPEAAKPESAAPVEASDQTENKAPEDGERTKRSASGRIAELFAQKRQAEAETYAARQEAQKLRDQLQSLNQRLNDPNTPLHEQESLRIQHAVKAERADELASSASVKEQLVAIRRAEAFAEKVAAVRDRLPDYDSVVTPQTPISEVAADLIAESEFGPQIAYHLGKNPEVARRIASLPPHLQGAEIARIEAKMSVPVRKISNAPTPPPRVGGGSSPSAKDPSQMSMGEYAAWRTRSGT